MPVTRTFGTELSPSFDEHVRQWIASGSPTAVPRVAASVLLVRDGGQGPEVFMQRRASTMAFAASMVVFPGGRVDPADDETDIDEAVLAAQAAQLGLTAEPARSVLGAAVREVEEESGVRVEVADLRPRGRWLTPAMEPRRYDTWFFAARMPAGQRALGETAETEAEGWGRPRDILAAGEAGTLRLMPPTIVNLEQLAGFASVGEFLADVPQMDQVEPVIVATADGYVMETTLP